VKMMNQLSPFIDVYNGLTIGNLDTLEQIYSEELSFQDQLHSIHGLKELTDYFAKLYRTVSSVKFELTNTLALDNVALIERNLSLSHPKLSNGKVILVEGARSLMFDQDGKVYHHRDYFDLGAMVYEHILVLGSLIRYLKRRLAE